MKGGNQDISLEAEKCLSGDVSIDVPYSEQILQESSTTSGFENSSGSVTIEYLNRQRKVFLSFISFFKKEINLIFMILYL